jgi:putative peptidoglycan lipid II flippase
MAKVDHSTSQVSGLLGSSRMALVLSLINLVIGVVSFLNQIVIAKTFGTGSEMDAFASIVALPSLISGLIPPLMIGVLVPSLIHHAPEKRRRLGHTLFWILLGLAILIGSGGILISPYWVNWFIQGRPDLASLQTPILETAWLLWAAVSVNILVSFFLAIRYLQKRFVLATMLPALNFVLTIILVIVFADDWSIRTLGLASLVSVLIQFIILFPDWWRDWGFSKSDFRANSTLIYGFAPAGLPNPTEMQRIWQSAASNETVNQPGNRSNQLETRTILARFLPMALSQLPYTTSPLIGMFWSASLGAGSQSYLSYSSSLAGFLSVMIGMGVATVALPYMAEGIRDGVQQDILRELETRLKFVFLVALWLAVIIFSLREPLLRLLLQRGAFNTQSVQGISHIIPFFLIGMIAVANMNLIRNIYYSMHSYWRTALIGIVIPVFYFCLAGLLSEWLGITGIGIAYACAYLAFLAFSLYWIPNTVTGLWSVELVFFILRATFAGFVTGCLTIQLNVLLMPYLWLPVALVTCAGIGSIAFWLIAFGSLPSNIRVRLRLVPKATTPPRE